MSDPTAATGAVWTSPDGRRWSLDPGGAAYTGLSGGNDLSAVVEDPLRIVVVGGSGDPEHVKVRIWVVVAGPRPYCAPLLF